MAVFEPIGIYRCAAVYRYETPRQGVFAHNSGVVELKEGFRFEEALRDLAGFDRIWLLFEFHLNQTWRPMVRPPVSPSGRRIGVFATRSPHRPNRIGMSCVELEKIEGLRLFVRNSDLLDRTPVLDIKPYIPRADAFPDARAGWLEDAHPDTWQVSIMPSAADDMAFIRSLSGLDLENFCRVQLTLDPLSTERKRLETMPDGTLTIGCRTWRIAFRADERTRTVEVFAVRSHYRAEELAAGTPDPYGDKAFHRAFLCRKNTP